MNSKARWTVLAVVLVGAGAPVGAQADAPASRDQSATWQELMDQARRLAAGGDEFVLNLAGAGEKSRVFVFYNNPRPFCYTYVISGEWVDSPSEGGYRSEDGRAVAGVRFVLPETVASVEGPTLLERVLINVTRRYEKASGSPLTGIELVPFESARPSTWQWKYAPFGRIVNGRAVTQGPPLKILMDLTPDAVVEITVAGTSNGEDVVRGIIASMRTTSDPQCYWPVLESMLKVVRPEP